MAHYNSNGRLIQKPTALPPSVPSRHHDSADSTNDVETIGPITYQRSNRSIVTHKASKVNGSALEGDLKTPLLGNTEMDELHQHEGSYPTIASDTRTKAVSTVDNPQSSASGSSADNNLTRSNTAASSNSTSSNNYEDLEADSTDKPFTSAVVGGQISLKVDVSFENLGLELPDGRKILSNITGCIEHGRCLAVMGPSGAGKSTFIK